eukprot:2970368-Alexandrium_andersonii.AAC.1
MPNIDVPHLETQRTSFHPCIKVRSTSALERAAGSASAAHHFYTVFRPPADAKLGNNAHL